MVLKVYCDRVWWYQTMMFKCKAISEKVLNPSIFFKCALRVVVLCFSNFFLKRLCKFLLKGTLI